MHPKIEARRKAVESAQQLQSLERRRETLLHDLRAVRDGLLQIRGDGMNLPTVAALAASAETLITTIEEIDVHGDDEHRKTCLAFFDSSLTFIESARRTLSAARGVMPD
ncbi:hypothetical protein [Azospirillum sp. TSO22-1]|uniref:hypothetical protein n=1 Tax=Azospirillum sp. TSO22-1 TaxID=716789 RepID=UPI000D61BE79|nr:hypothetical protein [Azospirillum sp. TSO22-1]PWC53489.1 hypothetical protein TSO221_10560 [Azospirillum sp. TSO22-1]